jgi:hypothetical protein
MFILLNVKMQHSKQEMKDIQAAFGGLFSEEI